MPMLLSLLAMFPTVADQAAAPAAGPAALAPTEIIAASPAADWTDMAASDLLVMDLTPDRDGKPRRVVIQLLPPPFAQGWIGNIRALAAAHWWDGTSVNRVQDNYVVQWGDASEKKPLPAGLATMPQEQYTVSLGNKGFWRAIEGEKRGHGTAVYPALSGDQYAQTVGWVKGWPVGSDADVPRDGRNIAWPIHCYGMVGVGRNMPPDTGTGAELYTVIGQAPRQLDRNIALVGRVVSGIEHLTSLPRGTAALGFYAKAEQRVPIVSVRLANELPAAEQPDLQYLSTDSASFARYADARANRRDPFYVRPAGAVDVCNVPVPVRQRP